ncbi:WD40/YVTN/BNR-like repeat-containing protein [Natrarchaeobius chitinivorans]|uniref:Uncharacterized protein n=1 Tax=Natrarchaeobius chitinivorans TaxID=1679083 RepID=A0A3N6MJN7_NATCH|nr:hypothetical protein [Natrarchaeobius chitinivorans]RQG94426.1 hypothetical protein EA473_12040 [Natrarchaeobius chitinivorans]
MSTATARFDGDGFVPFFRRYTKTWIHAVATAGLTAFGTLTFVDRWFAVLAIGSYVLPPIALYVSGGRASVDGEEEDVQRRSSVAESETERGGLERSERKREENRSRTTTEPDDRGDALEGEHERDSLEGEHERDSLEGEHERDGLEGEHERDSLETGVDGTATEDGTTIEQSGAETDRPRWGRVDSPTETTLSDVVVTDTDAAYAVGERGFVVTGGGQGSWNVLLEDGPAASGNDLRGVDATDDGGAVWIAGDSGSLGRIEADSGRHADYTAPRDLTDNWLGVAVGGPAGNETILLIDGSGEVLRGRYRDGDLEWAEPVKPGGGSSLSGVVLADESTGLCCDTNDGVFRTDDGGKSFDRIGLGGADGTLEDVAADGDGSALVCADDGVVHRFDGTTWTPERVGEAALTGITRSGDRIAVCSADGSVYERTADSTDWDRFETDVGLLAASLGPDRSVAVGDAGAIVERN